MWYRLENVHDVFELEDYFMSMTSAVTETGIDYLISDALEDKFDRNQQNTELDVNMPMSYLSVSCTC